MSECDSVTNHLNEFKTMINLLLYIDIKITKEEKCISLLCSLPNSWDSVIVDIGSNNNTLNIDDVVTYPLP